jgi:uncharacterized membrane protein
MEALSFAPLAVSTSEISLWLHIVAAVVGLGATFGTAVFFPVAMSMDPRHLPFVHRAQLTINRYMAGPGLLVILLTGVYQVIDENWEFGSFWISASFLIVFILGGLQGGYFIATDRKLEAMAAADIAASGDGQVELSEDYLSSSRVEGMVGGFAGLLVLAALLLMVIKPGA